MPSTTPSFLITPGHRPAVGRLDEGDGGPWPTRAAQVRETGQPESRTPLAIPGAMRASRIAVLLVVASLPAVGHAEDERAIGAVEARVVSGVAAGGGAGVAAWRRAPTHVGVVAEHAVAEQPWTSLTGEIFYEGGGRGAVGVGVGVRARPATGRLRVGAGVEALIAPYTLWGVVVGGGTCPLALPVGRACVDLEGRAYVLGDDLPDGRVAAELTVSLGVSFDGW
jgi:hypothetical protein